ncbi:LOW QUALITY PROTEIN: zinc finger protein MAGPIE [Neltuma alba]|uniref:LOW QUALITY PROTEIN: zinc finger protein MAGPIE n=1 Tax=Neltuma alba TaxID=207710 RepID=UPI0010A36CB0|nr:LOW QUALITY PROTEIN: zinc finger protein MAGPIE [Prosopis alba]
MLLEKMDDGEISNIGFPQNHPPTAASSNNTDPPPVLKRKRNLPGNPDPEAEVIALSPKTLMATNRFLCEICGKGFQRDQNLQLHRRGHNLPWKLKQRTSKEVKKRVYVCPEKSCVHNHPSRALGDLTGIKKHFCRKHGEKKWKCEKCSKRYAVQSDWKAHSKTCGTREYKCDCGTIFSRRDSFITHRAFCDALAEETARVNAASNMNNNISYNNIIGAALLGPNNNNMSTHFPSILKPISNTNTEEANNQTPIRGLSLWMGHHHQPHQSDHHQTIMPSNGNIGNPHDQNMHHQLGNHQLVSSHPQQLNWVFGNKLISSSSSCQELASTSIGMISVPSLYSSQNHQTYQTTSANMSATALLQKAAQIGATSTTCDPTFLGSLGLKCSTSQGVQEDDQGSNKYYGMYGSGSGSGSVLTNVGGGGSDQTTENNQASEMSQMHPAKRPRQVLQNEEGGQTRDFLGVGGVQTICHPSSINGWV